MAKREPKQPTLKPDTHRERRRVDVSIRLGVVGLMVASLFAAMFVRLWYLQVLDAPQFRAAAVSNQVRQVTTPAPRGFVLDRTGQLLVGNTTTIDVTLERAVFPQLGCGSRATIQPDGRVRYVAGKQRLTMPMPPVIPRLAAVLGTTPTAIIDDAQNCQYSPYEPVPVASGVGMPIVVQIEEHKSDFPGVEVQETSERSYPGGSLAAQVLGYDTHITAGQLAKLTSQGYHQNDLIGASGVEAAYEQQLRGRPGVTDLSVNSHGQVIGVVGQQAAQAGDDVQLTIDAGLQQELEKDLASEIQQLQHTFDPSQGIDFPAPDGAAVVLDPQNGDVLAMASYPSYDPSVWADGHISTAAYAALTAPSAHQPLDNRAIFGSWAPGSTFKLATATAALNDGLIGPSSIIYDPGIFRFPNCPSGPACPVLHNAVGDGALGPLDVSRAITASDDVFFYTLGYDFYAQSSRFGKEPIQDVAHQYGLGVPTHFVLGDTPYSWVDSPTVRKRLHAQAPKVYPDTWYPADSVEMAFGQGMTVVTPLQLANAYATFANGGTLYQPQIAARILDHNGKTVSDFPPKALGHVSMSPSTRQALLTGFEGVVTQPGGTAYGTFLGFPFGQMSVAGKTGTADTASTGTKEPTSLFVAFAPVDNPRYVVAVVIDQAGYGASGSAPVTRQVLQYLIQHPVTPVRQPPPDPGTAPAPPSPAPAGGANAPAGSPNAPAGSPNGPAAG